jgi:hypothetical protein
VDDDRLGRAIAAIDAVNRGDPTRVEVGRTRGPKELVHAQLVSDWVRRLTPEPSEALLIAARAHHLRRWTIARSSYPVGRVGYLRWRKALHEQHARDVGEILETVGYDGSTIARVQNLVRKHGLGTDPEVQVLEDALCLVFIETQLGDFARRVKPEKLAGIVAKTTQKMSPRAVQLALALDLDLEHRALLDELLGR